VGGAQSRLIDAADIVSFGIEWLEARHAAPALKPKQRRD
ncbi:TPA: aminoglycoside N-acetyltransferase AAC(3)-VIa, partial [Escherichia coli]